jgi:hypothetical protein
MNRLLACLLMIALLSFLGVGCGGSSQKDTKVRCPKCATAFTIEEGLKGFSP